MNEKSAEKIIDEMVASQKNFNALLLELKENANKEGFETYKKIFSEIMGAMLLDIVNPILKEFAHLKPKELK